MYIAFRTVGFHDAGTSRFFASTSIFCQGQMIFSVSSYVIGWQNSSGAFLFLDQYTMANFRESWTLDVYENMAGRLRDTVF